jgi:hypothetical protein
MFYNWYDPATLELLHTWPKDGSPVYPFVSSVDNAWFSTALMIVKNAVPQLRDEAQALRDHGLRVLLTRKRAAPTFRRGSCAAVSG